MRRRGVPSKRLLFERALLLLALMLTVGAFAAQNEQGPRLRVLSPSQGYVLGGLGERKISIVLEITCPDASLLTTDTGAIRFVEPNKNTRLFSDYVVARTEYTNHLGQTVAQVISVIPLARLELADFSVNPPVDFKQIRPKEGELRFTFPREAMVEAADFNFQVQDLAGNRSSAEEGKLIIGLASELWRPRIPAKDAP